MVFVTVWLSNSTSINLLPGSEIQMVVSVPEKGQSFTRSTYNTADLDDVFSTTKLSPNPKPGALVDPLSETLSESGLYQNNGEGPVGSEKKLRKRMKEFAKESNGINPPVNIFDDGVGSASSHIVAVKSKSKAMAAERAGRDEHVLDMPIVRGRDREEAMKLSLAQINDEPTSTPSSIPQPPLAWTPDPDPFRSTTHRMKDKCDSSAAELSGYPSAANNKEEMNDENSRGDITATALTDIKDFKKSMRSISTRGFDHISKPHMKLRTVSSPPLSGKQSTFDTPSTDQYFLAPSSPPSPKQPSSPPPPLQIPDARFIKQSDMDDPVPSPMPQSIPIPPLSLATYLQLELSSHKPSPLYIHRSQMSDFPYESSSIKLERLQNFLLLPPQLEQVLWFGALACLDSWLFTFTILPLRFLKALLILAQSWGHNAKNEVRSIFGYIYSGTGRMWKRQRGRSTAEVSARDTSTQIDPRLKTSTGSESSPPTLQLPSLVERENSRTAHAHPEQSGKRRSSNIHRQRMPRSTPSALQPDHKADIIKGFLIIISCTILMRFDASRIYHNIRGQAAIKLYVIYNVLEVCDRLFSALGQDVLECLFSTETLERRSDGRSKIWRPLWLFLLALVYNLIHATSLFYQVITLNVAVNSYSNALLTLLMSNQFVEIKSTVFKKFEKENLFQLTCADIVERFQLWLMLTIIASRNVIETGGLSLSLGLSGTNSGTESSFMSSSKGSNALPKSFTIFPEWIGQVMGPFLLVLGSEMLVDWVKHAYITKFNNSKPAIYGRFLDVLAKDYYSNAFASQNLTRRFGLPVIPLASLFIRASIQTYHMFITTYMPLPLATTATSLTVESETSSPAATAALQHIDHIFRRALGRSTIGSSSTIPSNNRNWTPDDIIASTTIIIFFLILYLILLATKLLLGICLLSFARHRYRTMKTRESVSTHTEGKRVGGWGTVEVDEDTRRWIYKDDKEGARRMRNRAALERQRDPKAEFYEGVGRYSMVAKRIW